VKVVLTMAHDVMISHSHADKTAADAACAALEARGIRCWIAPRDINPGRDWAASIVEAIRDAQIVLLVFSRHANQSPQVQREVERAANSGKVLLPLRIEDVLPEAALEFYLGTPHWLDAITPPFEAHLEKLADACTTLLAVIGRSPRAATSPITGLAPSQGGYSTPAPPQYRPPGSPPVPQPRPADRSTPAPSTAVEKEIPPPKSQPHTEERPGKVASSSKGRRTKTIAGILSIILIGLGVPLEIVGRHWRDSNFQNGPDFPPYFWVGVACLAIAGLIIFVMILNLIDQVATSEKFQGGVRHGSRTLGEYFSRVGSDVGSDNALPTDEHGPR
jgi:TIR domain